MWSQEQIGDICDTKNQNIDNIDSEHVFSLELSLKAQFEFKHDHIGSFPSDNLLHFHSNMVH